MNIQRRALLKQLGLGSAGMTVAAGLYQGAAVLEEGGGGGQRRVGKA